MLWNVAHWVISVIPKLGLLDPNRNPNSGGQSNVANELDRLPKAAQDDRREEINIMRLQGLRLTIKAMEPTATKNIL